MEPLKPRDKVTQHMTRDLSLIHISEPTTA